MHQRELFSASATRPIGPPCAFGDTGDGWTGRHHCAQCAAAVDAAIAFMEAARAAGTYDEDGYTPAERRALHRRPKA